MRLEDALPFQRPGHVERTSGVEPDSNYVGNVVSHHVHPQFGACRRICTHYLALIRGVRICMCFTGVKMVSRAGFEPAASCTPCMRSAKLS